MVRIALGVSVFLMFSCISSRPENSSPPRNFQNDFLNRINKVRTSGCRCGNTYMAPVEPLSWNYLLESSASSHARDMSQRKYFAHTSLSGKTIKNRIEDAGYTFSGMRTYAFGENIAMGQRSIEEVMKSWIKSEGHCKNMMNKNFREIGVAESNLYWVQDFGMRAAKN